MTVYRLVAIEASQPSVIEKILNGYAAKGYEVVSHAPAVKGFTFVMRRQE